MVRPTGYLASVALAALAGLHVAWGLGSPFPFRARDDLADAVVGAPEVPSPVACHGVAAALVTASAVTLDLPIGPRRLRRIGRAGLAGVLGVRGLLGLLGATDLVVPDSTSPRFRHLDRRVYSPLCLLLSAAAATSVRRPTTQASA